MRTFWHAVAYVVVLTLSCVAFFFMGALALSWITSGQLPIDNAPLPEPVVRGATGIGLVGGVAFTHYICFGGRR